MRHAPHVVACSLLCDGWFVFSTLGYRSVAERVDSTLNGPQAEKGRKRTEFQDSKGDLAAVLFEPPYHF